MGVVVVGVVVVRVVVMAAEVMGVGVVVVVVVGMKGRHGRAQHVHTRPMSTGHGCAQAVGWP